MRTHEPRTIGRTSRSRVAGGALVILAGAAVLSALTLLDVAAPWLLFSVGAIATAAWLVDGSSARYLGPGLVALAAGTGILVGNALDMDPRKAEHSLVYGSLGIALLLISFVNPMAARASGAFLLYTGLTVLLVDLSMGWWLTGVLLAWGGYWLYRANRSAGLPQPALDEAGFGREGARATTGTRIGAGAR